LRGTASHTIAKGEKMDLGEQQSNFPSVEMRVDVRETGLLYHGTKADLKVGDLLEVKHESNCFARPCQPTDPVNRDSLAYRKKYS